MTGLKEVRKRCGLCQEDVARAIGVSRSTVAMWETSSSYPRGETMVLLANLLCCTIDELYGLDPPKQEANRPGA